jgi:DNA helicase II / ATP-dependent DNA helicase PcrA
VALTRARDMLYVYFPLRYYRRPRGNDDVHAYAQLSRFLPPQVRSHFNEVAPPVEEQERARNGGPTGSPSEVDALLASLWSE